MGARRLKPSSDGLYPLKRRPALVLALGQRVRVKCTCEDKECPAPAGKGKYFGEVYDQNGSKIMVRFDEELKGPCRDTFEFDINNVHPANP